MHVRNNVKFLLTTYLNTNIHSHFNDADVRMVGMEKDVTNVPSVQDVPTENASEVPILAFAILIGVGIYAINQFASKSIRCSSRTIHKTSTS